jgi:guanylate kinase
MKTKIICLVGPSGSGKTHMACRLENEYGIPQIQSRTTRPKRKPDEVGHTFVTEEEFDTYQESHMIAYTKFGEHRYCCLHRDLTEPVMTYVIDEDGLLYLRKNFSEMYDIFAVKLYMCDHKRASLVTEERMERDRGKFTLDDDAFDYFIDTTDFNDNDRKTCKMIIRMYQHFDKLNS